MSVALIAILAAGVLPGYVKTVERSYWQDAQTLLLTIYAGEQVYFSANDVYLNPAAPPAPAVPPAWNLIFMDDPNFPGIPVTYTVAVGGGGTTFTATVTRNGGPCDGQTQTINQLRVLTSSGTWNTGAC